MVPEMRAGVIFCRLTRLEINKSFEQECARAVFGSDGSGVFGCTLESNRLISNLTLEFELTRSWL